MILYLYLVLAVVICVATARIAFPRTVKQPYTSRETAACEAVGLGFMVGAVWPIALPAALLWHYIVSSEVSK